MNAQPSDQITSEKIAGAKERKDTVFNDCANNNYSLIIYLFNSFLAQEWLNSMCLSGLLDAMKADIK